MMVQVMARKKDKTIGNAPDGRESSERKDVRFVLPETDEEVKGLLVEKPDEIVCFFNDGSSIVYRRVDLEK